MQEPLNVIYGLHLVGGKIRYVGLTSLGATKRLSGHYYRVDHGSHLPVHNWMRKHSDEEILTTVLEVCDTQDKLPEREIAWIATLETYQPLHPDGLNLTIGGESLIGHVMSPESRERNAAAQRGKVLSPEHRQKLSDAARGKTRSAEYRANISAHRRGTVCSDEQKKTISDTLKAKKSRGLHTRWHVNRGITKAGCEYCSES